MEDHALLAKLTEREKVCLRQWLERKSAKEIAADLQISHHAVEKRLKMARTKLGATSSLEAARMLGEEEGYGRAVAQRPDLASSSLAIQIATNRPLIFGAVAMGIFVAATLTFIMQPAGQTIATQQSGAPTREYDDQLDSTLSSLIAAAEIGPHGEVFLNRPVGDQRYSELNSGRYWQISCQGQEHFPSKSLGDRRLKVSGQKASAKPSHYDSNQFPNESLRIAERTTRLQGSAVECQFAVARSRDKSR